MSFMPKSTRSQCGGQACGLKCAPKETQELNYDAILATILSTILRALRTKPTEACVVKDFSLVIAEGSQSQLTSGLWLRPVLASQF